MDCGLDSSGDETELSDGEQADEPDAVSDQPSDPVGLPAISVCDAQRLLRQVGELVFGGSTQCGASVCPASGEGRRCRMAEWTDQPAYQRLAISCDLDLNVL